MGFHLSDEVKIDNVSTGATNGTSDVNGSSVNMSGFGGVCFVGRVATAASGNYLKAQQSDDDGATDGWSDIEGSKVDVGASDEVQILDVRGQTKLFVRPVLVRGTSTVAGDITALRYNPRTLPVTNALSGTAAVEQLSAVEEGTA